MQISQGRTVERPAPGMYLATLVDVVEQPQKPTRYGVKDRLRLHWVLSRFDGTLYLGKNGQPVEAIAEYNAILTQKSTLRSVLTSILGQEPPKVGSSEQLETLIIGRSNVLTLINVPNPNDANDPYVNVDSISQLPPGLPPPPPIPSSYVRAKQRAQQQYQQFKDARQVQPSGVPSNAVSL